MTPFIPFPPAAPAPPCPQQPDVTPWEPAEETLFTRLHVNEGISGLESIVLKGSGVLLRAIPHQWPRDVGIQRTSDGVFLRARPADKTQKLACRLIKLFYPDPFSAYLLLGTTSTSFEEGVQFAKAASKEQAMSMIQGGNYSPWKLEGREGAFIGVTSIFCSLASMHYQGFFTQERVFEHMNQPERKLSPEWAARLERVVASAPKDIPKRFRGDAQMSRRYMGSIIALTIEKIAEEVGIPPENLLILQHGSVHSDMEHAWGYGRTIILHNPALGPQPTKSWTQRQRIQFESLSTAYAHNKQHLEANGFQTFDVPGFARGYIEECNGYFLNGLMFQDIETGALTFISSAMFSKYVNEEEPRATQESFFDRMRSLGIRVCFVDCGDAEGGGIHCQSSDQWTQEARSRFPHQYTPARTAHFAPCIRTFVKLKYPPDSVPLRVPSICTNFTGEMPIRAARWVKKPIFVLSVPWEGGQFWFTDVPETRYRILPGQNWALAMADKKT